MQNIFDNMDAMVEVLQSPVNSRMVEEITKNMMKHSMRGNDSVVSSLVILAGPTAVGKSELSIRLAKAIDGEIISADSIQVYRHMDIGSAKLPAEERKGVPHHLIDILDPTEPFHVVLFQSLVRQAITEIRERGRIPILVGGTGFYIQAVLYDIDFTDEGEDIALRESLEEAAKIQGPEVLYEKLMAIDPKACESIHANNIKRVIRAIEFYEKTGKRISEHNKEQRRKNSPYRYAYFVLHDERARLYERIDKRVDTMLNKGLIDEVEHLKGMGCEPDMVSMQGLGYKEILQYLNGDCTLEDAVYRIKRDTRHFAKRQMTWFRREKDVIWISRSDYDKEHCPDQDGAILEDILKHLADRGIINELA